MNHVDRAEQLAKDGLFPVGTEADIAAALQLASELLALKVETSSLRSRERDALRRLKADPNDLEAWTTLHQIRGGRAPTIFDSRTRTISIGSSKRNRLTRTRAEPQLNAALRVLVDVWERHQGPVSTYPGSMAMSFLGAALRHLGVHATKSAPQALRFRLGRLS